MLTDAVHCTFQHRARMVFEAPGAIGMILQKSDGAVGSSYFVSEDRDDTTYLPTLEITYADGAGIKSALDNGERIIARMRPPGMPLF